MRWKGGGGKVCSPSHLSPESYIRRAMGNYIRAFCVGEEVPPITKVVQWLGTRGVSVKVADGDPMKMQSRGWEQVSLIYKEGRVPMIGRGTRADAKGTGPASAAGAGES